MRISDSETQFVDKAGLDHAISELKEYISKIQGGGINLSDYVTKNELQAKLDALHINVDLSAYATKEELNNAIKSINLSSYALKSDIPSLEGFATKDYVDKEVAKVSSSGSVDLSNYYTKDQVYTKSETNALIPTVKDGTNGKDGTDGITPHVDSTTKHWKIGDTDTGVVAEGVNGKDGINGSDGKNGTNGTDGKDGVSPTVTVTKEGSVATITCTDKNGTTTAAISDGKDGTSGGGGGASGITYAYDTEVKTGDTYFDGRPIYMQIFHIDPLSSSPSDAITYSNYKNQTPFANKIISAEPVWYTTTSSQKIFTGNVVQAFSPVTGSYSGSITYINEILMKVAWIQVWQNSTTFAITVTRGQDMYAYACDIFVKYVKSA